MTVLALKAASMEATIELWEGESRLSHDAWEPGRELSNQLLERIKKNLKGQKMSFDDIEGIVLFKGPGSFTSLRIGATVANTIAYSQQVPIVGTAGEDWLSKGIGRLSAGESDNQVIPEYGAPANITKPKSY